MDLSEKRITLIPSKTKKKKREVRIPIQPDLLAFLESVPIQSDKPDAPVFEKLSQTRIGDRTGLSQTFNGIMKAAGVDRGKASRTVEEGKAGVGRVTYERGFHSLRHTFTSWLRNAGVSEEDRMALTGHSIIGHSNCALCGEPLDRPCLDTSGCAFPRGHRLFCYCDTWLHIDCLHDWPDRAEFSEAYFLQRYEQFRREQWWILADTPDWYVGFIPPGQYMSIPGSEDLVEVRVRDWPFVLWGHAEQWTEFLAGGWRADQSGLYGMAGARAEVVIREVSSVLPSTEAIVGTINDRFQSTR